MPMLKIMTNLTIDTATGESLLTKASKTVASSLGKPESYVMVSLESAVPMSFAGSTAPLAYLEMKSIGLSDSQTAPTSRALCTLLEKSLNIPSDRVYIEFTNAPGKMWGYDGGTF